MIVFRQKKFNISAFRDISVLVSEIIEKYRRK